MPVSSSRLSYSDCEALFEKALDDAKGARYQVADGDFGKNQYFRMRMHQFRALDRQDNKTIHEIGEKLHGRSVYDVLIVQLKQDVEGKWWTYVVHTEIDPAEIEVLSEIEGEFTVIEKVEYQQATPQQLAPILRITDQTIKRRV